MKVLIAPDSFKEALDAEAAARAIADGVRIARPDAAVDLCPLGDGGEGSAALIAQARAGAAKTERVHDALGRRRRARWWWIETNRGAVVELAEAAGLAQLAPAERDPRITTTYGVGELLRAALAAGCESVLLCAGGSATVDGGAGCLQALGWRFLDRRGRLLEGFLCGGRLRDVDRIEPPPARRWRLTVLCDVDNPLTGRDGAAPVFAPQKGADADCVLELAAGLEHWAEVLRRDTGTDVRAIPHGGAAGGIAAGLHAALGARLVSGFDVLSREVRLAERMARADLVVTGEGRFDLQSARDKVIAGVGRLARSCGVPAVALVGAADAGGEELRAAAERLGLREVRVVTPPGASLSEALAGAADNLTRAARDLLAGEDGA